MCLAVLVLEQLVLIDRFKFHTVLFFVEEVRMLRFSGTLGILLLTATTLWIAVFYIGIQEYSVFMEGYSEWCASTRQGDFEQHGLYVDTFPILFHHEWHHGQAMLSGGCILLCSWIASALVKKKSQILFSVFVGITIALGFMIAARIPNIGYTVEYLYVIWNGHDCRVTLNPFLHLGGGCEVCTSPMYYATSSSVLPRNLLLYLLYGELSSFSLMGVYIAMKKRLSRCTGTGYKRLYSELKKTKTPLLVVFLFVTAIPTIAVLTGLVNILVFVIQNGGNLKIELFHNDAILYFSSGNSGIIVNHVFLFAGAFAPSFLMCLHFLLKQRKIRKTTRV
jgi:hypothetical protein